MMRTNLFAWVFAATMLVGTRAGVSATPEGVRGRLVGVAKGSRELRGKAGELPGKVAELLGMVAVVPEDRMGEEGKRFARASEVAAYVRMRPWSVVYGDRWSRTWPGVAVEGWPGEGDAGALRELLKDGDGEVRSLAVEALGALDLPEDVGRIGGLLGDGAAGAVVLGWSEQRSAMYWRSREANPLVPERTWHERTVGTYAREALRVMTGHRFDGKDPAGVTFAEWWKTHDLRKESLWYWQQRLVREERPVVMMERKAGESDLEFRARREAEEDGRRKALHEATVAELRGLPLDVQWKVFLLTVPDGGSPSVDVTGPANPFFPEGLVSILPAWRLRQLTEGTNVWPDVEGGRGLMLARLALAADQYLLGYGDPMPYKQALARAIEREGAGGRLRAVLVSRLMLPAPAGRMDDPGFREGYLRKELAGTEEGYTREVIAAEMVRENLGAQWPALERVFYSEKSRPAGESDARIGVLRALGEGPHTKEKARRLAELINDPRNEGLFTQENRVMGMDMYRYWAMRGVDAIAGKKVVTDEMEEGFKEPGKAKWALGELRRLASDLAKE